GMTALGEPSYMFYLIAAPVGAMIADIDHDNSKLGRSRKNIMAAVSTLFASLAIVAISFFLVDGYTNGRFMPAVLTVLLVAVPFLILTSLSKIEFIKKNLKFMVKHRGLMHTLIIPAFLFAATYFIEEPTFKILITGLMIGYITHLIADLLTVRGCPILFPLSKKNINLMRIKTGSVWEYIAAAAICACAAALFLSGLVVV
ncbi:MAG: metal-dependent hydrolase, partial [Oscillospiraceae bacterium]|nr:metal-dependent hydrolase [Oscillospiraceae bacterium]